MPIGAVDPAAIATAGRSIQSRFGCEAHSAAPIAIPAAAWDAQRHQFGSVEFMLALASLDSQGDGRLMGLTECDLFIPMLTFVFGQAQLRGRVALVSTARLRQEFYRVAPDPDLLACRLEKEIGHELGHCFGLFHCPDRECVMSLSSSIQEVDRKSAGFCRTCGRLLQVELKGEEHESEMADSSGR